MGFAPRVSSQAVVYGIAGEIAFLPGREDARLASRSRVTDQVLKHHLDGKKHDKWRVLGLLRDTSGGGGGIARWTPRARRSQIPRTSSS